MGATMVNAVFSTQDYEKFKRLLGNRDIEATRVEKIKRSIVENGYIESTIIVNEKYEVIDGQGRLAALRELNLPVDYIVVNGIGIDECIAMNIYQSNWKLTDFIESYAESGNRNYINFNKLIQEFADLGVIVCYTATTGRFGANNLKVIQRKTLKCTDEDYEHAREQLTYLRRFKAMLNSMNAGCKTYMVALSFCYTHPAIDNERLYNQMCKHQEHIVPCTTVKHALDVIQKIYNYHKRGEIMYISVEYDKEMRKRKSDKTIIIQNRRNK